MADGEILCACDFSCLNPPGKSDCQDLGGKLARVGGENIVNQLDCM